jgi:uncharacterized protein YndB with AHSA1/START domain
MSVKKEPSGRRSVEVEVEVPGTPEEVWQAIGTGPGVSSWFVPTEIEERLGGAIKVRFGPGMESVKKLTTWEPPHRLAADGPGMGPNAPPMATEWIVEARAGGTCVVRVVHSLFAATDDWDDQLSGTESGWPGFFRVLRLYLERFKGQRPASFQIMLPTPGTVDEVWDRLLRGLGLAGLAAGARFTTAPGTPTLSGHVERQGVGAEHELLLLVDAPGAGIARIGTLGMGPMTAVLLTAYF